MIFDNHVMYMRGMTFKDRIEDEWAKVKWGSSFSIELSCMNCKRFCFWILTASYQSYTTFPIQAPKAACHKMTCLIENGVFTSGSWKQDQPALIEWK